MKTTEAIVLAGGFGTRLKHIVSDMPKPMAPVNGAPFLSCLMKKLSFAGIKHIVLSTGYFHEKIESFYKHSFNDMTISYAREMEPLGTGGAIRFALEKTTTDSVLVLNGDTLFNIDFEYFDTFYQTKKTALAVALRIEKDVSRYGAVSVSKTGKITAFTEKSQASGEGMINGGIYLLKKKWIETLPLPKTFSFEKEILEKLYKENEFYGLPFDEYFIDIGVPEDYERAQHELSTFIS
jgi:D-glycero-alpha-D-manno-heptose 1-phosphate guanylyltransferase